MDLEMMRERLQHRLMLQRPAMLTNEQFYTGTQPLTWLDPDVVRSFGGRLKPLNVNLARLAVDSVCQRLQVTGFRSSPGEVVDSELLDLWQQAGLDETSQLAQQDALIFGRSYLLAWADGSGRPLITAESPLQMVVERDPVTGTVVAAMKRWTDVDGYAHSLLLTADSVTEYASKTATTNDVLLQQVASVLYTSDDAVKVSEDPNPLGVVPVVPLVCRPRLGHLDGESDITDLQGLVSAVGKVGSDLMAAAEWSAAPRRWVTGLIPSDALGHVTQDQAEEMQRKIRTAWEEARNSKFVAATHEDTRFGTFEQAALTNYETAIRLLTGQIAALASLPTWYVDNAAVNPVSADALRTGEARLTAKTQQRQRWFSGPYEDLMRLAVLIRDGAADPRLDDLQTLWLDPEPATVAQTADAQAKLYGAKIPLEVERILTESPTVEDPEAAPLMVQMPEQPTRRRTVVRDEHGFITEVIDAAS
jgi:hypothetical protein